MSRQVVRDVNLLRRMLRPGRRILTTTSPKAVLSTPALIPALNLPSADLTITRIGANSIFSFEQDGRNVNVENGAILLRVPTDSGGARIRSSALTVGITGTTVMFEHHRRTYTKLIVLEGSSEAWLTKYPGKRIRVRGWPNARCESWRDTVA